jgi:glutamate synthase (NADPH/NADH) small chain
MAKAVSKKRTPMPTQDPHVRAHNFNEVALGFSEADAKTEADRCLKCKKRNCTEGCPVEVPIPEFIAAIQNGDHAGAFRTVMSKNLLPAICGRVCPQESQCEKFCTLGKVKDSEPVAIGRLERYIADWGREKMPPDHTACPMTNGVKVAVIGAGPAGLTCAGELARMGYEVTVFEAFHKLGGVLTYGIPEFRLPKAIVQSEVQNLTCVGVKFVLNQVMGKALDVNDLKAKGYKAVFVGVGAGLPVFMKIPGVELNGVLSANEFLTRVNLMKAYDFPRSDTMVDIGKHVAVVGGGNVAMDSARTALRLGAEEVMVVYRRSEEEMPARREEYEHAVEEGIKFLFLTNPTKILGNPEGQVNAIEVQQMTLGEPDKSGRRKPVVVPGSERTMPVDLVIMAIGTQANPVFTKVTPGLKLNEWGYIEVNDKMQSSLPYLFAGGDIVTGSATVISAMAAGRKAAASMHEYLQSLKTQPK